jgi:hypothetical protein
MLRYGDAIQKIKEILDESSIPHIICEECGSIIIADSKEMLRKEGRGIEMDKNDPRFSTISQQIIDQLRARHNELHSMPGSPEERNKMAKLIEDGRALNRIVDLLRGRVE